MQRFTSQRKMKILTFSTRPQNSLNGVLDETTTANTRGRSSRAHPRLCKFTSSSRPSSSRCPILSSLSLFLRRRPLPFPPSSRPLSLMSLVKQSPWRGHEGFFRQLHFLLFFVPKALCYALLLFPSISVRTFGIQLYEILIVLVLKIVLSRCNLNLC